MGLSITDAAALITKGYKVSELQEVNKILEANKEDDKNIIELAKKLGFSDFKTTMQLFDMGAQSHTEDPQNENETDHNTDEHTEGNDSTSDDSPKDQYCDQFHFHFVDLQYAIVPPCQIVAW